ncbi:Trp biosynthesis-associated membrane protein [Calidifontibacter terrae]
MTDPETTPAENLAESPTEAPKRNASSKRSVLSAAAILTIALLLLTTRSWATGTVSDTITGTLHASARGSSAAPTAVAGALVAGAAIIALLASRRVGRIVAALGLTLGGALAAYGAVHVALDPSTVLREKIAGESGHAAASVAGASASFWVWLAAFCAIALAALGVMALVVGARWSGLGRRYDAPTRAVTSDWDQLTAGTDPTATERGED